MAALEFAVLQWAQSMHTPWLDAVMVFVTKTGDFGWIWLGAAAVCLCIRKTRRTGIAMLLALAFSLLVGNGILKPLIARVRPCDLPAWEGLALLIPHPGGYSFPSGHAFSSFAAASAVFFHHRKAGIAALLWAAAVGVSRVYLAVHFPTDVLCGAVLGMLFGKAAAFLAARRQGNLD